MSKSFTGNFIADTYTGILHSEVSLPSTGKVDIYDGEGNVSAFKLGRAGKGGAIDGDFTATSGSIPTLVSTTISTTSLNSVNINTTKLVSSSIDTASLSASGSITSNVVNSSTINATSFTSINATVGSLLITSGALSVATIANTNLTSTNITTSNLNSVNIGNSNLITTKTLQVQDMSCSSGATFNTITATRGIFGSINAGNIEYPTTSTPRTLFDLIYPVGAIYLSVINVNPTTTFPGTTWVNTANGLILVGAGTGTDSNGVARGFNVGLNNGEYQHTLSKDEIPAHKHTGYDLIVADASGNAVDTFDYLAGKQVVNHEDSGHTARNAVDMTTSTNGRRGGELKIDNTGGGAAHNVTPPTFGVYIWQRTA